jgi:hypothetical protein
MLLDDLLASRAHESHGPGTPLPVLSIDPVAVPPAGEIGRKTARLRLAALEDAARRNLRSAEEARRVLAYEHEQLQHESSARVRAEGEAAALRRELDRLRASEEQRAVHAKRLAARSVRAELAAEHDRVVDELRRLQGSIGDHDRLVEEYAERLREEQAARAALRAELDEAEKARRLAERSLERAVASARKHAEDEVHHLSEADAALADIRSERDQLADMVAELRSDDATSKLRAELVNRLTDLAEAQEQLVDLGARVEGLESELGKTRAGSDELRAHAAALGDELAAARATIAEQEADLGAARAATEHHQARAATHAPAAEATTTGAPAEPASEPDRPPLARRMPRRSRNAEPRREPTPVRIRAAASARAPEPAPHLVPEAPREDAGTPAPDVVAPVPAAPAPAAAAAAAVPAPPPTPAPSPDDIVPGAGVRRTAMAELTALASTKGPDDFTPRRSR